MAGELVKARRRYDRADVAAHEDLVTGSWRPLVFANPDLPAGQVDKAAFTLCAVMHLHTALRRRDLFAAGADLRPFHDPGQDTDDRRSSILG